MLNFIEAIAVAGPVIVCIVAGVVMVATRLARWRRDRDVEAITCTCFDCCCRERDEAEVRERERSNADDVTWNTEVIAPVGAILYKADPAGTPSGPIATIDFKETGCQPRRNADGSFTVTWDSDGGIRYS